MTTSRTPASLRSRRSNSATMLPCGDTSSPQAAATLDWLTGMGLAFHGPSPEPPNRVPRMHNVVPNAKAYVAALQSKLLRHGGELHCNTSVTQILLDADRVTGIAADSPAGPVRYHASLGVVLAAGDYANSQALIERFKGQQYAAIEGINPHALGDGHQLAEQAGARLINMDVTYGPELRFVPPPTRRDVFSQLLPATGLASRIAGKLLPLVPRSLINAYIKRLLVTWQHPEDSLFREGADPRQSRGPAILRRRRLARPRDRRRESTRQGCLHLARQAAHGDVQCLASLHFHRARNCLRLRRRLSAAATRRCRRRDFAREAVRSAKYPPPLANSNRRRNQPHSRGRQASTAARQPVGSARAGTGLLHHDRRRRRHHRAARSPEPRRPPHPRPFCHRPKRPRRPNPLGPRPATSPGPSPAAA